MKSITTVFLRLKHWQLFLFLVVVPSVGEVISFILNLMTVHSPQDLGNGAIVLGVLTLGALTALLVSPFFLWFWALGSFLNSIVPPGLRLGTGFFHFAVTYPSIYIIFAAHFFLGPSPTWPPVILPFHFFAMACIFYDLYFVSKNLVLAQTGKNVKFYDYAGPFFLIWFYPVGIWFIQPEINRLFADRRNANVFAEAN
jgi:hypothetical protein